MSAPFVTVASLDALRELGTQALLRPTGAQVVFTVAKHGTLEATDKSSRRMQIAFCSMRAKERRRLARSAGESTMSKDWNARHPFDDLACTRVPLPNGEGWKVMLVRANAVLTGFDIQDIDTGEPLEAFDAEATKRQGIMETILRGGVLTPDELEWFYQLDPVGAVISFLVLHREPPYSVERIVKAWGEIPHSTRQHVMVPECLASMGVGEVEAPKVDLWDIAPPSSVEGMFGLSVDKGKGEA